MRADPTVSRSETVAWQRALDFEGGLSAAVARALLRVRISATEQERMSGLLEKARAGGLTAAEVGLLDAYERLGCLLGILHSRARQALKKTGARQ